jgi:hypothetical protein
VEGAFQIDGILRRHDEKRLGEGPHLSVDRHLPLLHGLKQRGLRARNGAVDSSRQKNVGLDRSLNGAERSGAPVENVHAQNVGREQVGRKLHALKLAAKRYGKRLDERRFPDAGQIVEQDMPFRKQSRYHQVDLLLLPDDNLPNLLLQPKGKFRNPASHEKTSFPEYILCKPE